MKRSRRMVKILSITGGLAALAAAGLVAPRAPTALAAPTRACAHPVWTDTGTNSFDQYTADSPYVNAMDMWNATASPITQTMGVCDHASWYVDDTVASTTNTAVLGYPDVHEDYINWTTGAMPTLSSYKTMTSGYAGRGAGVGIYDVAYDIWLNGVASAGSNEVMIWTENRGQVPAGSVVAADITVSGKQWDLWATPDNGYLAFVPVRGRSYKAGRLDLKAFFTVLMRQGHIPWTSTLGQIDYGVEVVNTGGVDAKFTCTDFWIHST